MGKIQRVRQLLKPAGLVLGPLIVLAGYISTGQDILSWGFPVWLWQAIGAAIFFASVIAILYGHQKRLDRIPDGAKAAESTTEGNKTISQVDNYGWLPGLLDDQFNNPYNFLYSRLIRVFPSSPTEIGLVIEWFNTSIFDLKFESVSGEVRMGEVNIFGESLGHQIVLTNYPALSACKSCTCTCSILVSDKILEQFRDAQIKGRGLTWNLYLNWKFATIGFTRPFNFNGPPTDGTVLVPSRS